MSGKGPGFSDGSMRPEPPGGQRAIPSVSPDFTVRFHSLSSGSINQEPECLLARDNMTKTFLCKVQNIISRSLRCPAILCAARRRTFRSTRQPQLLGVDLPAAEAFGDLVGNTRSPSKGVLPIIYGRACFSGAVLFDDFLCPPSAGLAERKGSGRRARDLRRLSALSPARSSPFTACRWLTEVCL